MVIQYLNNHLKQGGAGMKCPCCKLDEDLGDGDKIDLFKVIQICTDWGYENFHRCNNCGILFEKLDVKIVGEIKP